MTSARKARDRLGYRLTLAHRVAIFTIDPNRVPWARGNGTDFERYRFRNAGFCIGLSGTTETSGDTASTNTPTTTAVTDQLECTDPARNDFRKPCRLYTQYYRTV